MLAGLVSLVLAFGPPVLPPEGSSEAPAPEVPVEPVEPEAPAPEAPPEVEPEPPVEPEAPPIEPEVPLDEAPIAVTPAEPAEPAEPPIEGPVEPTTPPVQRPGGSTPTPTPIAEPTIAPPPSVTPEPEPAPASEPEPEGTPPAAKPEAEAKPENTRKLGGFRIARLGVSARLGYTNGVSQKNGIFDRNKSLQDSIDNGTPTTSGAGDLGTTRFGGFQGGFGIDAEVVGINVWLDFHKFFRPGGMWSVLLGYDHEFGFGERYRLDVGVGAGVQKVFLGKALGDLYYDKTNPLAVNIGTLGVEGRAMADFHIKIVGPLFTGPYAMIGYHYLWSANTTEVTAEKGMHFSLGWALRVDLAMPKLLGRGRGKR